MYLVSSIKILIQKLKEDGWNNFFNSIILFSKKYDIDILNLDAQYIKNRDRCQRDHIIVKHHYHFDIFNAIIDFQL